MIVKRWTEVEPDCFGPDKDKRTGRRELVIFVREAVTIRNFRGREHTRRRRRTVGFQGKTANECRQKLADFVDREDVHLLDGLAAQRK